MTINIDKWGILRVIHNFLPFPLAGDPEAPWAGAVPASSTFTRKPRSAKALAALAPPKPLPKTKIEGQLCLPVVTFSNNVACKDRSSCTASPVLL
jgi:hypothetical protein